MGKKKTIQEVKNLFNKKGWQLLSDEYVNADSKLLCKCPNGHIKYTTYHLFQQNGCKCARCYGNYKKTREDIKNILSAEGYELLDVMPKRKIKYQCPNGHIKTVLLRHFIEGNRCAECVYDNKRIGIKHIEKMCQEKNWKLLTNNYINVKQKFSCICNNGHIIEKTYQTIQHDCPVCYGNNLKSFEEVEKFILSKGYKIIGGKYKNSKSVLKLLCPNDHIYKISVNGFRQGYRCTRCKSGRISEISQQWLNNMGVNEREIYLNIKGDKFFVDGIDYNTNTIYEFFGDYWHGHPTRNGTNQTNKEKFVVLYDNTISRIVKLIDNYNVCCIWEYEFKRDFNPHHFYKGSSISAQKVNTMFKEKIL